MSKAIEFNLEEASKEDAPAGLKLLSKVVPAYNEFIEALTTHLASTNTEEAEKAYIVNPSTKEDKELATQIEQAEKLIARNTALLAEHAKTEVLKNVAPDFDKQKSEAHVKDSKNEVRKSAEVVLDSFEILGYVKPKSKTPTGRVSEWESTHEYGETLLKILQSIPRKIDAGVTSDSDKDSPQSVAKREVRKAAKEWGRKNGFQVADKGQLSGELLEKYLAQNKADAQKWANANE